MTHKVYHICILANDFAAVKNKYRSKCLIKVMNIFSNLLFFFFKYRTDFPVISMLISLGSKIFPKLCVVRARMGGEGGWERLEVKGERDNMRICISCLRGSYCLETLIHHVIKKVLIAEQGNGYMFIYL